ncbi:hypothetical protein J1614_006789 [Plenodomus biglobosus]|nr:hypothetical protein J1614_006789 [Plenodomus biglobosus]
MIKPLYQAWSQDPVQHAKVDPDPSLPHPISISSMLSPTMVSYPTIFSPTPPILPIPSTVYLDRQSNSQTIEPHFGCDDNETLVVQVAPDERRSLALPPCFFAML